MIRKLSLEKGFRIITEHELGTARGKRKFRDASGEEAGVGAPRRPRVPHLLRVALLPRLSVQGWVLYDRPFDPIVTYGQQQHYVDVNL